MKRKWVCAAAAVLLALPALSRAGIIYTSGASDGVATWNKNMSFVDTGSVSNGTMLGGYYYNYGGANAGRETPVMQFSLASYTGMTDVTARLGFYVTGGENLSWAYVRFCDANGTGTITYNHGNGGTRVMGGQLSGTGWFSIDVSSYVQTALNKGYGWVTFNIEMSNWDMSTTVVASEGATGAYAGLGPQLSIVPEPATMSLLGLGLLSLLKRKKQ